MKKQPTASQQLVAVRKEMKKMLKAHDLCGLIVLSNDEAAEYILELTSPWSCAQLLKKDGRITGIRINTRDMALPRAEKKKMLESTISFFLSMEEILSSMLAMTTQTKESLLKEIKVERSDPE